MVKHLEKPSFEIYDNYQTIHIVHKHGPII